MEETANSLLSHARGRVEAYRSNLGRLVLWAHPTLFGALLGIEPREVVRCRKLFESARESSIAACSYALAKAAGVKPPAWDAWTQPSIAREDKGGIRINVSLLDMLPPPLGIQVLVMRALLFRRFEVARLIDARTQRRLAEWIGLDLRMLFEAVPPGPDLSAVGALQRLPIEPVESVALHALAEEGISILARDVGARLGSTCPLLGCALPAPLTEPEWMNGVPAQVDADGSVKLFAALPTWMGAWAWLFGSDGIETAPQTSNG